MDFPAAQTTFRQLLLQIDPSVRNSFLTWISSSFPPPDDDALETATEQLKQISIDVRSMVATSGILPSEAILPPPTLDIRHTVQIDSFLYDDEILDEYFEAGKMAKYYCTNCEARTIRPLNILSHSMSIDRLSFIFTSLLPRLDGKTVIDVGSRFGSVLFGAYVYSNAASIIGIEINTDLCRIQQSVIDKRGMNGRIRILQGDVMWHPAVMQSGHVVFLHNVFEFFLPKNEEIRCWQFLKENIRRAGTMIVAVPDIRDCLVKLKVDPDLFLGGWVVKVPVDEICSVEDVTLYSVV
uniref:Methyltransferase type 11 domain-containing protein n=1 Tax=Strigamia maritima TaxID=126957 RepID=T1JFA0_STRMM